MQELNLGVSKPLVHCVLTLDDRKGTNSSLLEDAGCLRRLVCGDRSNLVRLQLVFKEVYGKRFRTASPG